MRAPRKFRVKVALFPTQQQGLWGTGDQEALGHKYRVFSHETGSGKCAEEARPIASKHWDVAPIGKPRWKGHFTETGSWADMARLKV